MGQTSYSVRCLHHHTSAPGASTRARGGERGGGGEAELGERWRSGRGGVSGTPQGRSETHLHLTPYFSATRLVYLFTIARTQPGTIIEPSLSTRLFHPARPMSDRPHRAYHGISLSRKEQINECVGGPAGASSRISSPRPPFEVDEDETTASAISTAFEA